MKRSIVIMLIGIFSLGAFYYRDVYGRLWDKETLNNGCINCHSQFADSLKKKVIHKPVVEGKCILCHNPHVSKYKGLLKEGSSGLCYGCHGKDKGFNAPVVHKPVADGKCLLCHEAHAADISALLKKEGGKTCFECHAEKTIITAANVHPEVKKGNCSACHTPHSSYVVDLLKKEKKELCATCHDASKRRFVNAHMGYETRGSDCLECHSGHSSKNGSLLRASLHKPFGEKKCDTCHINGSKRLKDVNYTLCTQCHEGSMPSFNKIYSHLIPGQNGNFCLNCHNAHASDGSFLLKDKESRVCFSCHSDTKMMVKKSNYIHPELRKGQCSSCHTAHGSNNMYFLTKGSKTCSTEKCHPTQGRFTHPIGEKTIDPRTKLPMDCSTCHNPMGSREKNILRLKGDRELCVQCHQV